MPGHELSPGLLETYMSRFELTKEQVLEQKAAFDVLDTNSNGVITFEELKEANAKYSEGFSEKELQEQFSELDVDHSGHVTLQEFLAVYVKGEFGREVPIVHVREDTENMIQRIEVDDLQKKVRRKVPRFAERRRVQSNLEAIVDEELIERLDPSTEMRLSTKNSARFYSRAAILFLRGAEGKKPVDSLRIKALGETINMAAVVAARVESEGLGRVVKVQTDYPEMQPSGRGCAQMSIDVIRVPKP
mmetsp:Transcript_17565/g.55018  ORF Transcript_17565/g.55018 Transcript_17565/m.55018 type:complete len:246 (-) Transcript_17565:84-821(-)